VFPFQIKMQCVHGSHFPYPAENPPPSC
jgi:hypothetical protein